MVDIGNYSTDPRNNPTGGGISQLAFFAPLITFILVSNSFVIYAVSMYPPLKTPSNQLILSLAVTDLLNALCVSVTCYYTIMETWQFGKIGCQIWLFMIIFLASSSNLHLCAISIDRYKAISSPLTYGFNRSYKKSLVISCFVWTLSFASISPPYLFQWGAEWVEIFLEDTPCFCQLDKYYAIYLFLTMFFIPLLIIMLTYSKLYVLNRKRHMAKIKRALESIELRKLKITWYANHDMQAKKHDILPHSEEIYNISYPDQVNRDIRNERPQLEVYENVNEIITQPKTDEFESSEVELDLASLFEDCKVEEEESNQEQNNLTNCEAKVGMAAKNVEIERESGTACQEGDSCQSNQFVFVNGSKRRQMVSNFSSIKNINDLLQPRRCLHCQARMPRTNNLRICQICSAPNDLLIAASRSRMEMMIQKERRSMFIIAIIVCTFIVCWGPAFILLLTMAVNPSTSINIWVNVVAWLLAYLNSACNPVIYTIFNADFRDAFKNLFR